MGVKKIKTLGREGGYALHSLPPQIDGDSEFAERLDTDPPPTFVTRTYSSSDQLEKDLLVSFKTTYTHHSFLVQSGTRTG